MSGICFSIERGVLVKLPIIFCMILSLRGFDLHEKTQEAFCKALCGVGKNITDCNCTILLANGISNYTQNLQKSLFCRSDDILSFKLQTSMENKLRYVVEKKKNITEWQYATQGSLLGSTIFSVNRLENNTSYKVRTWIIHNKVIYAPVETEWVKTLKSDVKPLPVKELWSDYYFTKNSSHALIQWIPGEDLSCYYFLAYNNGEFNEYFYITNPRTLFQMTLDNIEYNKTYTMSIRASNSRSLESDAKEITMKTPSCLFIHKNITICAPETPNNLKVEEIPKSENFSYYDIKITWSKPNYIPDYYDIRFTSTAENITKYLNVSGEDTSAVINGVKILHLYHVIIRAWSTAGSSEPVLYGGQVKITPYKSSNLLVILVLVGLFLLICFCTGSSIFINQRFLRKRRVQKRKQYFKDLEQKCPSSTNNTMCYEMKEHLEDEWEIDSKDVTFQKILGQGAFGVVRYGLLMKGKSQIEVAVKTLKSSPTREELGHFQHELEIMKSVGSHPHLVSLIGVCVKENCGPILVVEYCSKGDLQNYLKSIWEKIMSTQTETNKNAREFANKVYDMEPVNLHNNELINSRELLSFARQIAKGMEYLSKLKILHRDLAARNVLICEDKTVKVSDFGLSRDVYRDNIYHKKVGGRLPIRWMAIESLTHQQYTTQSDIWSFGILLWEIVTLGGNPYPGIPTENLLKLLRAGYRMDCPINCKREIYDIMLNCWKANPKDRLTFTEIRQVIENLLECETEYLQVDLNTCIEMNTLQINSYKNVQSQKTLFERYVKPIWH